MMDYLITFLVLLFIINNCVDVLFLSYITDKNKDEIIKVFKENGTKIQGEDAKGN